MMKWSRILIVLYFIYIFFIFQSYKFLILNVSLAYIPLELANLACKKKWHPMFFLAPSGSMAIILPEFAVFIDRLLPFGEFTCQCDADWCFFK